MRCVSEKLRYGMIDCRRVKPSPSFNKLFTSSVTRLLQSLQSYSGSSSSPSQSVLSYHYPDFKFVEVSDAYVRSQLCVLKPGKAVDLDNIPARLLVNFVDIVANPLTAIINISLQTRVSPSKWKAARVIPCSKKIRLIIWTTIDLSLFCLQFLRC